MVLVAALGVLLGACTRADRPQRERRNPGTNAGGREGFEITSIRPGSLIEETGLQPGDVILSVNGRPVSGDTDGRRLDAELKHEDRFWLVVDRSGEIRNLYYQVGDPRKG